MFVSDRDDPLVEPRMDLLEAIQLGFDGDRAALVSCVPGELAYIDGDYDRYILRRHPVS
jgi:hypothetical protein